MIQLHARAGKTAKSAPPYAGEKWTVIAYGDTRFTDASNVIAVNPKVRRWLVQKIDEEHPDAILVSGDLPYTGSDANDCAVFRAETKIWREHNLHFYPALGNHELKGGEDAGLANWWKTFPELNSRRWYSVPFRNAYFICLDTDAPLGQGSPQRSWFDHELMQLPQETQYVFVVQHHPPIVDLPMDFGHTPHANEVEFASHVEDEARTLPVQFIVIAGHIHNYERFQQRGITFLVSGGGGAKPHEVPRGPEDLFPGRDFPNYHYVKFVFDGERIQGSMVRLATFLADEAKWETKDNFVIPAPTKMH